MQNAFPRHFWPALLAAALGLAGLLFWWLESGSVPEKPGKIEQQRPVADVESVARPEVASPKAVARMPEPVAAVEQARMLQLTPEQAERVADWIRQLDAASDAAERDEVMEDARSHEDTEVLVEMVMHQLGKVGAEERIEVLQKLVGNSGVSQIKAFVRGLDDPDPEVRIASLQMARDQEPEVRVPVFEYGLESTDPTVRSDSFQELTREVNIKAAIPALMRALGLSDPGVREQAQSELLLRLADTRTEPFVDAAEARRWWEENGRRYDDRMYRID
jgi:HEAT repeat protein